MYTANDLLLLVPDRSVFESAEGDFARQILVISRFEAAATVNNRIFLTKVLAAARLNLEQDALFVELTDNQPVGLLMDTRRKKPEYVLVFGVPAPQLGLQLTIQPYQPIVFQQMTLLFADALPEIETDKEKKAQLWTSLKTLFF